jgi:hypothetical protein
VRAGTIVADPPRYAPQRSVIARTCRAADRLERADDPVRRPPAGPSTMTVAPRLLSRDWRRSDDPRGREVIGDSWARSSSVQPQPAARAAHRPASCSWDRRSTPGGARPSARGHHPVLVNACHRPSASLSRSSQRVARRARRTHDGLDS